MKFLPWTNLWCWTVAGLLLASTANAISPFTMRLGASGAIDIDIDPPDGFYGSWTAGLAYAPLDQVSHGGQCYECTAANTSKEPGVATDWTDYWRQFEDPRLFVFGFRADAREGVDVDYADGYDLVYPRPPDDDIPMLYFPADAPYDRLSQDIQPPASTAVWELDLVGMGAGDSVTLAWALANDGGSLDGRPLRLVDRNSGAVLVSDMTATTSTVLADSDRSLLIVYGSLNHPPVARGDSAAMLQADGSIQIPFSQLLANDYDVDAGDTLDVIAVGDPYRELGSGKGESDYGTTAIDTENRVVTYSPPATLPVDWTGTVYVVYTIRDSNLTDPREASATVELIVAPTVLAVPEPTDLIVEPGMPLTVTYCLTYTLPLNSLALELTLPRAGTAPDQSFWPFADSSYSDDAATADPTVTTGAGADGQWGTADDTGVVILDFGTALPPSGTHFSFVVNVPANAASADVPALAAYKATGAEPEALQQVMPDLVVRAAYTVTFVSAGNGTLTGETTQLLEPGLVSTQVTAVPALGYHFVRWTWGAGESSTDNPLTITGGDAAMTVTAEFAINQYTVTFAFTGAGAILGVNPQTVPHGQDTTAVTAVPGDEYYFVQWSDGSTANPRIVTNVIADMTVTAEFQLLVPEDDMQGHFDLVFRDQTNAALRKIWDLSGHYAGAVGEYQLTLDLVHDEKGTITGVGSLAGTVGGQAFNVVDIPLKGSGKGKGGVVTVKAGLKGANATTTVSLKLALTLSGLTLTGTVSGSVSDTVGGKAPIGSGCTLDLPAGMDGSYTLPVELVINAKGAINGTSLLTLSNGRTVDLLVKGKRSGSQALLQFAGDKVANPAFGAIKIKITIQPYTNRTATIRAVSGKAFGQSLKWPL